MDAPESLAFLPLLETAQNIGPETLEKLRSLRSQALTYSAITRQWQAVSATNE